MKSDVLFSVVIPTYNRAALLPNAIDSILEQTYFQFEVIAVDDGSADDTREAMLPYLTDERVKYFKIQNSERGAARNFGAKQSKGDYITFLDTDDVFLPWHLEVAASKILLAKFPSAFHLGYEVAHPSGHTDNMPILPSPINDKLLEGNFMSCMGVFLRRDIALENPFDEDRQLSGSEDYELWMRIAARVPILTFPDVTSRLINHEGRSVVRMDKKKLITRMNLLEEKLLRNKYFIERYGNRLNVFRCYNALYLALHLGLLGDRLSALNKLGLAVRQNPRVLVSYRFIVALKKIVLW